MKSSLWEKIKMAGIFWLARRLPDCKDATRMMSESMDRKMSLMERINIRLHLFVCIACVRYLQQLKVIRHAMEYQRREEALESAADASLSEEARERMKRALTAE